MNRLLFIGIVGHAMRGLAWAAAQQGNEVVGLDEGATEGPGTQWLDEHGLSWTKTPAPKLLNGVDLVVISGGTPADDPMTTEAARRGIRVASFAEYLGEVTAAQRSLVVAGTHGKTTTTSLITWLLETAGREPDYLIGIQPFNFDSSARLAGSKVVVIEGDEYKASSLDPRSKLEFYHPDVLVLTSVEMDHPDVFRDLDEVKDRFAGVVRGLPHDGRLVVWADDPVTSEFATLTSARTVLYGLDAGHVQARNVAYLAAGIEFDLQIDREISGRLAVPLYGRHNVLNSLAAASVAIGEGLSFEQIVAGAASFKGAYRRFNVLTPADASVTVIDDYAHHPTEVAATIQAAKLHFKNRRLIAVFRPHTYSRTATLRTELEGAFEQADVVYITDIESARESGAEATVSGADIVAGIGQTAAYAPDRTQLADDIVGATRPGDVILCMTVSGHTKLAEELRDRTAA